MSDLLEKIEVVDELIRDLEKINSKLESGAFVYAWRDNRRVLSKLQLIRKKTISQSQKESPSDEE